MNHGIKVALGAACLLLLAACAPQPAHQTDAATFAATTQDGLYVAGTIAPLGSFEYEAAPSYTENAVLRHKTAIALKRGEITVDHAQAVLDQTDHVRALLDEAVKSCHESDKTGRCRGDSRQAHALLGKARAALAAIH